MKQVWQKLFLISLPIASLGIAPINTVKAQQVVPDNTLGAENSIVTPFNSQIDIINGGATRGNNLFHSFQQFNVDVGRGVYFSNPVEFQNIFSRVTGSNPSNINGVLGVVNINTNTNLFLINPNGIIFGPNASLDINGSFFASTANSLVFGNGFEFSATNPQAPPLLTVNIPIGLRFRDNPGGITVRGFGHEGFDQNGRLVGASNNFISPTLQVPAGENLALVGGNVNLDGGVLQVLGGQVELGGLTAAGTVGINSDFSLSFPTDVTLADVSLTNEAGINVITDQFGDGSININARNISLSGQSLLTAGIAENFGVVDFPAGDITLNATGETRIDQSRIENNVNAGTIADSRDINIITGSFVLTNGSVLNASNLGSAEKFAGYINVNASGTVSITDSAIFSQGRSGRIFIGQSNTNDPSLIPSSILIDNSRLDTTSSLDTNIAGDININARDQIFILDSRIFSNGTFGRISIGQSDANNQFLIPSSVYIDNSKLSTDGFGTELAGDININARDQIFIIDSNIFSEGYFGRISIGQSDPNNQSFIPSSVSLDNSKLSTDGSGTELAGEININAREQIFIINKSELTTTNTDSGFAGQINLNAENQISIADSRISSVGRFGRIFIGASNPDALSTTTIPSNININNSTLNTTNTGTDFAGNINIYARDQIFITNNSGLTATNTGTGSAGIIDINAGNQISITNNSEISSQGTLGRILIGQSNDQFLRPSNISIDNSILSTTNSGTDFAGDILLNARDLISLNQSTIESNGLLGYITIGTLENGATSSPKEVRIDLSSLSTSNNSVQSAAEQPITVGDISIAARDRISINQSSVEAFTERLGNAGNVTIQAKNGDISLANGSRIFSNVESTGIGFAGNINIAARNFTLTNGTQLQTLVRGGGFAGSIIIDATGDVTFQGSRAFSSVETGAIGQGGNIDVTARSFSLSDGAALVTSTFGQALDNFRADAGDIRVNVSQSFSARGGSQLRSDTSGQGDAGNVRIEAQNGDVLLTDAGTTVFSGVGQSGIGKGGDIDIQARNFSLTGGAEVIALTLGNGNAGKITVNATDSIFLSGVAPFPRLEDGTEGGFSSGLINTTERGANGLGGAINITTSKLQISDGAVLNARSRSNFRGGDITVNADTLELTGGGQILTTSFSNGDAGNITINAPDSINISGSDPTFFDRKNQVAQAFNQEQANFTIDPVSSESGIFANTAPGSTAKGGNVTINTTNLRVEDGATITVSSPQGQAGNLEITAKNINLDNGSITAETAITRPSEQGANITLKGLDLLSLRNNSLISAQAINAANGGNINIDAANGFVVAFPGGNNGSDIIARAVGGDGGNIQITARSIFGLAQREAISGNRTNDIDTRSQFGQTGTINLNIINFEPIQGLIELPDNVVDPTQLIAQNPCQQGVGSEFIITGRGGLPVNPNQTLTSDNVRVDLGSPVANNLTANKTAPLPSTTTTVKQIVPAQGWVFNDKGKVVLTAYDPTNSGYQRNMQTATSCAAAR